MQTNKATNTLYFHSDAELIAIAGELIGNQNLHLTVKESVAIILAKL